MSLGHLLMNSYQWTVDKLISLYYFPNPYGETVLFTERKLKGNYPLRDKEKAELKYLTSKWQRRFIIPSYFSAENIQS